MRLFSPSVLNRRVGPATSVRRSGRLGTRRVRRRRAMAASARPARRLGGACGANRCLLVSALLALAWLARKHGATSGGLNLVVPDRAHAAVIPHIQRADLAGFVTAHARHDPRGPGRAGSGLNAWQKLRRQTHDQKLPLEPLPPGTWRHPTRVM